MRASTTTSTCHVGAIGPHDQSPTSRSFTLPLLFSRQYGLKHNWRPMHSKIEVGKERKLSARANAKATSEGGVVPYGTYRSGKEYYLDEQDVLTFLDPPKELIPLDPSSYSPASYLWKKIEDIPEERRHHLLSLLNPRLRSRAWGVAGRRYDDPKLAKKSASALLSDGNCAGSLELWKCRTSGAPLPIAWINSSQKAIFGCTDGNTYGRLIGGYPLSGIINSLSPLYFSVRQVNEVMSTEHPCDLAYEFGDGVLNLPEYPQEFPKPSSSNGRIPYSGLKLFGHLRSYDTARHPWPFNDQVVIYIRHLGPGVLVGQAWQEGEALQQVPKKLCGEILMVKDYFASSSKD